MPDVIRYRETLLGMQKRDVTIAADAFSEIWIKRIREQHPNVPLLVTASGLFYYFKQDKVLGVI